MVSTGNAGRAATKGKVSASSMKLEMRSLSELVGALFSDSSTGGLGISVHNQSLPPTVISRQRSPLELTPALTEQADTGSENDLLGCPPQCSENS